MESMRRGSKFTFKTTLAWLPRTALPVITFVQDGYTVLEKRFIPNSDEVDLTFRVIQEPEYKSLTDISTVISEEESLKFHKGYCNVQIRFYGSNGHTYPTDITFFEVKDSLSDEVLTDYGV